MWEQVGVGGHFTYHALRDVLRARRLATRSGAGPSWTAARVLLGSSVDEADAGADLSHRSVRVRRRAALRHGDGLAIVGQRPFPRDEEHDLVAAPGLREQRFGGSRNTNGALLRHGEGSLPGSGASVRKE